MFPERVRYRKRYHRTGHELRRWAEANKDLIAAFLRAEGERI